MEIAPGDLETYRRQHPLADSIELVRSLLLPGDASSSGVMIAVGDAAGRLLWVEGDLDMRMITGEMGLITGTNWSEGALGTTASGTALELGSSVQIHQVEHYNRFVAPWSCTAAPVFDPETRQVLGFIDVTGGEEAATPQARMLVDATVRAVESNLLVKRLKERGAQSVARLPQRRLRATRAVLSVLGRDRARLEVSGPESETVVDVSARHAEILLMLATHRHGLSADTLAELVYGETATADTLRPEMVRLRKVLQRLSDDITLESRPYRVSIPLETDAQRILSLLDRGAHRAALTEYRGPILPESKAPGVVDIRDALRDALRETMLTEASLDVLLAYAETPEAADDIEVLRLCLQLLPARSRRRPGLVARIEKIEQSLSV